MNGTTLLSLSYEEALKLLQNTGKTVELVVSQIFYRPNAAVADVNNKQNSYRNVDGNNEHQRNREIDNSFMNYEIARENMEKNKNFEQQTYRNRPPNDCDDSSNRHSKHRKNKTDSRLMSAKSLPDLPKVCIAFVFIEIDFLFLSFCLCFSTIFH